VKPTFYRRITANVLMIPRTGSETGLEPARHVSYDLIVSAADRLG
jgi:hypothetical protein